ncbi:MAG: anaerobic glycerol-3-phosphate dehydrogenase subunit C [bacterium]
MKFNPNSEDFWKEEVLDKELRRVFDICNSCRLCFNLCPSFVALFELIDGDRVDGDVYKLNSEEIEGIVDLCFQCKLCYVKCPYVPPHKFDVDYPRSMLWAKAIRARRRGVTLQDRFLGNPDFIGRLGTLLPSLINFANTNRLSRLLMEKTIGIHRDKALPKYRSETFARWFRKHISEGEARAETSAKGRVALFYTCSVNYNFPDIGISAVQVLERNRIEVICPEQRCCGMPRLDGGDIESATESAKFNVKNLANAAERGYDIVSLGPTCTYMLKKEYPLLLDTDDARVVSERTRDVCEYLMELKGRDKLNTDFSISLGKILYHMPCHLKAQNIGYKSRDLLSLVPGTEILTVERCSGVDGTWGMKREYFRSSLEVANPIFEEVKNEKPDFVVSDCPLAAGQIEQNTGIRPFHPVQMIRRAYGLDSARD